MENNERKQPKHLPQLRAYLTNADIEPRKRILNVMLVAIVTGSLLCLIPMLISGVSTLWLNVLLVVTSILALILSVKYKKIDTAGTIMAFATIGFFLPAMYFTQGGYESGMPLWFVASTIGFFILTAERLRYFVLFLSILINTGCMVLQIYYPQLVTKLASESAEQLDIITSFVICAVVVALIVLVFISTEKKQREKLQQQKNELDEKNDELEYALEYDAMTRIGNRYSYNKRIAELGSLPLRTDLMLIAADVDGLKKANDTIGHDAGDELITGAAEVLSKTFAPYGQVFRIGGDEFQAIIHTKKLPDELRNDLINNIKAWRGKKLKTIELSVGFADNKELHASDIYELQKLSDIRMYDAKQEHYRRSSVSKLNECYGREGQYRRAILLDAVISFEVDLSRDQLETALIRTEDGVMKDYFETLGVTPFKSFKQYIDSFAGSIAKEDREAHFRFFDRERLISCYRRNELEQIHDCWILDPSGKRRLSRCILLIGEHERTHDVIALCIIKDITEKQ